MKYTRQKITIAPYTVHACLPESKEPLPVIYLIGESEISQDIWEKLILAMDKKECLPFALITFGPLDWDNDLSIWPAQGIYKNQNFSGQADKTLEHLLNKVVPVCTEQFNLNKTQGIVGYSLAGLMALWTSYNTDAFSLIGSCSGSLWYPGFVDYVKEHTQPSQKKIYLSLGDREENTKHETMKKVGQATRNIYQILKENQIMTFLEMNPGGHFTNPEDRLV